MTSFVIISVTESGRVEFRMGPKTRGGGARKVEPGRASQEG